MTTHAQILAECMDYPWEYIPEAGREKMHKDALRIAEPLLKEQATEIAELKAKLAEVTPLAKFGAHMLENNTENNEAMNMAYYFGLVILTPDKAEIYPNIEATLEQLLKD